MLKRLLRRFLRVDFGLQSFDHLFEGRFSNVQLEFFAELQKLTHEGQPLSRGGSLPRVAVILRVHPQRLLGLRVARGVAPPALVG
eukprot:15471545-Alexandrium_andersonii.AAC.1